MKSWTHAWRLLIGMAAMISLSACAIHQQPEQSFSGRQDDALRHPFDYSPGMEDPNISGGGFGEFDPQAFGKDLNHVLDP